MYRILANCVVGLGFSKRGFAAGLRRRPDLIGCDAGSSDFGPAFLGRGSDSKSELAVSRDLDIMVRGAREIGVPLVFGSVGGPGAAPHVDRFRDQLAGISQRAGIKLRVALIYADQSKTGVADAVRASRLRGLGPVPDLTVDDVMSSERIVAMMGAGPYQEALAAGADVIVAGRSTDPAIFAGGPLSRGLPLGPAWHAAKCVDKGYLATTRPADGSPVLATIDDEGFTIEPTREGSRCTVRSVSSLTMHENPDPYSVAQPSGVIDTSECKYEAVGETAVRVTGSQFRVTPPSVKLEGSRRIGHRAVAILGMRDPRLLRRLDEFLDEFRSRLGRGLDSIGLPASEYTLRFRTYGRDGVLGDVEPARPSSPHEVGLVIDVVAKSAADAKTVVSRAVPIGSRLDLLGVLGGGGNFAAPFSPNVLDGGEVYEWSVWHLMDVADENDPFSIEYVEV